MRAFNCLALALGFGQSALCQDLLVALSRYPELSTFSDVVRNLPGGLQSILPSGLLSNSTRGVTILVPDNKAFLDFTKSVGIPDVLELPANQLLPLLSYHVLASNLTGEDMAAPDGLIVPTSLQGEQYNNRTAGADLIDKYGAEAARGQVIYLSSNPINPIGARRAGPSSVNVRGGNGQDSSMKAVDGQWDLGSFQIVNSVLVPPQTCSITIQAQGSLSSLSDALNKTDLWTALNTTPNVTCLAPNNNAFKSADNPEDALNSTELTGALLFHTLPFPLYSTFIVSGTKIGSLAPGLDVTVVKVGDDIYFNDAKLISPNVLTNNGLIHVLDKVMTPNGKAPVQSSQTASPSPTSSSKPNNASPLARGVGGGLPALLAAALLLL